MLLQSSSVRLIAVQQAHYLRLVTHFRVPQKRVNRIRARNAGKIIMYTFHIENVNRLIYNVLRCTNTYVIILQKTNTLKT